jgi:hypothetical protein
MRSLVLASAALAGLAVALPAQAALVLTPTSATIGTGDIGSAFTVNYNGNKDGTILAGLTATGIFSLASVTNGGKTFTFNYSIDNTSTNPPITDSRISIFGFNVNPDILPITDPVSPPSATGLFGGGVGSGGVPNAQPDVNVCFRAGGGGGQCDGGGGGGVGIDDAAALGTFTLNFASAQTSLTLNNFYIRYQTLASTESSATSASGLGTVTSAVPEPATWGMMIIGFGLVGASMRYRRRATRVTFA